MMDPEFPYVLLVNAGIADLQNLRDRAEECTRTEAAGPSKHRVTEQNEALYFCFENRAAAKRFEMYCTLTQVACRRIGDWTP